MNHSLISNPNVIALIAGVGFMCFSMGWELPAVALLIGFTILARRLPKRTQSFYVCAVFLLLLFKQWGPWWLSGLVIMRSALEGWRGSRKDRYLMIFAIYLLFGPRLFGILGLGYLGPPISMAGAILLSLGEAYSGFLLLIKKIKLVNSH